ncbi:FtsK/SpoIIIE domain-containing protein [Rhodopirellula sp. P2]|uniref:FtsK/SpoIIIE domain-containing protein n=1 Tax=Rhodopirellula sp. P2 TaxID=2127060 RepID=UPI002367707D|nr:FtsK/SpoIIIE domain-containing protein [Rhodopirellula sp. P2]WDQ15257.1 FtsK/SpoIIIE domain-containing protein [Rhodopirellula sp. P2]
MKDSAVSPALLFAPERQRRLLHGLIQRVAASREEHSRLVRQQGDQHADIEQRLTDQLAAVKQNCHTDRINTLRQWDIAQEQMIAAYEVATLQTRDQLRRCGVRFRRQLAEDEAVIHGKVEKRLIAIKNQYNARKDQPKKLAAKEHHQLDAALAESNEDIEWARALTLRRLNRLLDVQTPSDLYAEFGEAPPHKVEDALELIRRQNRRLKATVSEMQTGFAAHVVDAVYYLPSLVAVLLLIFSGTSILLKAEPLIHYLIGSVIVSGLIGFTCYLILMWPLRKMTRSLHPATERIRLASQDAVLQAKRISTAAAKKTSQELILQRDSHIKEAQQWQQNQLQDLREDLAAKQVAEEARLKDQLKRIEEQFQTSFADLQQSMRERANQTATDISQKLSQSDAAAGQTLQAVAEQHRHTLESLAQRLQSGMHRGLMRILAANDLVEYRYPHWDELLSNPPPQHPGIDFLPLGSIRLGNRLKQQFDSALGYDTSHHLERTGDPHDEADILNRLQVPDTMPIAMHRRNHSGVIIEAPTAHIEDAINIAHQMLWRLLSAAPPGQARVTLIDPAGRGQNFSSFLALADHAPSLIHHRVWTQGDQITARIADISQHAENILQSCLRDQYKRLEDYNEVAGSLAQPYEAIAAVGFPDGLSREAHSHLASLIRSGIRCGVFVILVVDNKHEWPADMPMFDHPNLLRLKYGDAGLDTGEETARKDPSVAFDGIDRSSLNGEPVQPNEDGIIPIGSKRRVRMLDEGLTAGHWRLLNAGLDEFEFWPAPPPMPQDRSALIQRIGRLAQEASRVIVPLTSLLPEERIPTADHTSTAADGLNIVIGSSGAGRHRSLDLGEGVRQHVLIAGKTGSGKSTLLHSIVTSGAAMYSPDELQFYLLDFKKGVEFKIYADAKLPHARVIGIESEREFGRSVLQRLDSEMTTRGELFRAAGVQELGAYRRTCPAKVMPRLMLVVDEFQELFTRDDTLASDCTALLDRLVRQGRSFGIHVVLSSQSLAGANSLPRATLGQMAVRIAMQCSEADAALILSDDNTAARLISRPGEAIYNDASGLVEGNQPFQVAYLETAEQVQLLNEVGQRDEAWNRELGAAVVFEGNRPGRFTAEMARQAIDASQPSDTLVGLLGEAVELGPPCALRFQSNTGRNALLIGSARNRPSVLSCIIASAKAHRPELALVLFDGSRAEEGDSVAQWTQQHDVDAQIIRTRDAETAMIQLAQFVGTRLGKPTQEASTTDELGTPAPAFSLDSTGTLVSAKNQANDVSPIENLPLSNDTPLLVVLDGLDRFRDLRQSESMNFSLDAASQISGCDALQTVLREGPAVNVFVIASLPSAETLNRWLPRQSHHDLELRLVGPLNAGDSSLLIDSPAAADLSAATMILYDDSDGRMTKFRLCDPPSSGELTSLLATT